MREREERERERSRYLGDKLLLVKLIEIIELTPDLSDRDLGSD